MARPPTKNSPPLSTDATAIPGGPAPSVVKSAQPVVAGAMMRKKELIDAVTDRAGVKKRDCKPVIEAMLAVLGEAIAEDRELNLQPFGKLKVNRRKDVPNGNVFICRLRQNNKNPDQSSEDQIAAKGDVDPKA